MKYLLLLIYCLTIIFHANAQLGCTDPQATNYDQNAMENDGSCVYSTTNYLPEEIVELPNSLPEPSGLASFDDQLWTHLDGGNEDKLFQIDTLTGEIIHSVIVVGADNIDWEELAEDEEYLYLGDFGNNNGNRMDLKVYKIKKTDLSQNAVVPEVIAFSFSDQVDFTPAHNANNYDCEAFFAHGDSLHLFSKNWVDFKTRHYVLPKTSGTQIAELRDSMNVQGYITAADITEQGEIVLLGYSIVGNAFMWLFFDYQDGQFFSGNKRKIALGNVLNISQPEGLCFSQGRDGYIASENISIFPQKLLKFSISDWVTNIVDPAFEVQSEEIRIEVFPNPFSNKINIKIPEMVNTPFQVWLLNDQAQLLKSWNFENRSSKKTISLNLKKVNLSRGHYWLKIFNEQSFQKTMKLLCVEKP